MTSCLSSTRLARAAVFAVVCVMVSVGGHAFAGGGLVAPGMLAAGAAGAFALAWVLSGRERGLGVVLGATTAAQVVLHELFDRTPYPADPPPAPLIVPGEWHHYPGAGMTAAHLVVALLTGWWLYRGESALWLMARLWGMPVPPVPGRFALAVPCPEAGPVRRAVPSDTPAPFGALDVAAPIHRRGPPARRHAGRTVPLIFATRG
ncbi:MFS transporter [Spongiactinospora rosea]|uniref:MFS transporter n=1 Tax=Spongiactinospora rosea TaxID=2248750 RepID=A0A366M2K5_9ACTN|nr:MFS transporter [Spongiactinospora rosea]RBQ19990.1 MFS transporter [Spongiactinospora rosea]